MSDWPKPLSTADLASPHIVAELKSWRRAPAPRGVLAALVLETLSRHRAYSTTELREMLAPEWAGKHLQRSLLYALKSLCTRGMVICTAPGNNDRPALWKRSPR